MSRGLMSGVCLSLLTAATLAGATERKGAGQEDVLSSLRPFMSRYQRLAVIYDRMRQLSTQNPMAAHLQQIGTTEYGTPIHAITIGDTCGNKPRLLLVCGQQGPGWMSPAVCIGIAHMYLNTYKTNPEVEAAIAAHPIDIIPVLNPDGYEYSQTQDRAWSKNRRRLPSPDVHCAGVHLNHNYSYSFGQSPSNPDPCTVTYRGPDAFSEPETRALRDFIHGRNIKASIHFSPPGQYILWSSVQTWAQTQTPDEATFHRIGNLMRTAMEQPYGTRWKAGAGKTIEASMGLALPAGSMIDWLYGMHGILAYDIGLRNPGKGQLADPPPSQIAPSILEAFAATRVLHKNMP